MTCRLCTRRPIPADRPFTVCVSHVVPVEESEMQPKPEKVQPTKPCERAGCTNHLTKRPRESFVTFAKRRFCGMACAGTLPKETKDAAAPATLPVEKLAEMQGVPATPRTVEPTPGWTDADMDAAVKAYRAGAKVYAAAKEFGIPPASLYLELQRRGLYVQEKYRGELAVEAEPSARPVRSSYRSNVSRSDRSARIEEQVAIYLEEGWSEVDARNRAEAMYRDVPVRGGEPHISRAFLRARAEHDAVSRPGVE